MDKICSYETLFIVDVQQGEEGVKTSSPDLSLPTVLLSLLMSGASVSSHTRSTTLPRGITFL